MRKLRTLLGSILAIDRIYVRFLLVGGLNTVFGYSVYGISLLFGLNYMLAILISTVLGVLFNFKTVGSVVFKNNSRRLIIRFAAVYVIIYLINTLTLTVFNNLEFDLFLAQAVMVLPMAILSFGLNKKFVFSERL